MEQTTPQKANSQHQKALLKTNLTMRTIKKPLKPHGLTTPEKTQFQRVNRLLYQQTHRAEFQQKSSTQLTPKSPLQRTNQPLKRCQFWIFTTLINTEIERRYDNLDFELLPLDLAI